MTSLNTSAILSAISVMEKQLALLRAQIDAPSTKETKETKNVKKTSSGDEKEKKPREPTAWLLFTQRVRDLLRQSGVEKKRLGPEMTKFCSELNKENGDLASWADADILARHAAWQPPSSPPASVVEEEKPKKASDGEKKPRKSAWEGLSEEERAAKIAKMQAGREAKKAEKKAVAADAEETAPASDAEESTSSSQKKKRGPKKQSEMTPEELAADKAKRAARKAEKEAKKAAAPSPSAPSSPALPPLPPSPSSEAETSRFKRVLLDGKRYLVNMASGHAYFREADDTQGDWAGIFRRAGGPKGGPWVDDSVPEPLYADLEELD